MTHLAPSPVVRKSVAQTEAAQSSEPPRQTTPRPFIVPLVLLISAFGPYLPVGARTDQIALYIIALLFAPAAVYNLKRAGAVPLLATGWLLLNILAMVGLVLPVTKPTPFATGVSLANADILLSALATCLVVVALPSDRERLQATIRWGGHIVLWATVFNVLVAFAQSRTDLSSILHHWWSLNAESSAARAATLGRFTGILNQPALAGLMYGIALLVAVYLYSDRLKVLVPLILVLSAGGFLSISKAFVLVSLPVFVLALARVRGRRMRYLVAGTATLATLAALSYVIKLPGVDQLFSLLDTLTNEGGQIGTLTGNRFGAHSSVIPLASSLWRTSPLLGLGYPGWRVATDSGWIQILMLTGAFGVGIFACILLGITRAYRRGRDGLSSPGYALCGGLVWIGWLGSVAFPILTGNRIGLIWWILFALLIRTSVADNRQAGFSP